MKKLFLISILIALMFSVKAQTLFPVNQSIGNATTNNLLYTINGGVKPTVGLILPTYTDTTAANANLYIKWYDGAMIKTTTPIVAIWYRYLAIQKWVQLLPSGGSTGDVGWLTVGNTWANDVDDLTFGTLSGNSILFKTRALTRLILDSTGILAESGTTVGLGYDPSNGNKLTQFSGGGGAVPISSLTAATGTNDINNANYLQQWRWNSFDGDGNAGLQLSANTTATISNTALFETVVQGANATSGVTSVAANFSNTHTGTSSTNIAGYFSATGGSNNYAIIVPASSGSVGIGNSAPTSLLSLGTAGSQIGTLSMAGNTSGTITIQPQAAAGTYNFNLPTTAGTSGYLLTSAGGVGSPMTWTDPAAYTAVPTWQQTLTAGSTLTQANDIEADGYDFRINDAGELGLAGDSITLSANAGSNHLHIKADSSSLNKKLSYESDLSSTFTQYSLVDKNYVDGPYIYGEYLNTTFPGASLPTGFAKLDGAATITFNNPSISITGGDGNVSNNYVRNTDTSASNNYDYIWEFTLDTKFTDYTSQGKWFGKRSVNGAALWSQIAMFRYGGSSSLGRVVLFSINGTGNGSAVDSSGTISMADGNTYRIKYSQIQNVINVKLSRLSSGTEVESVYINYRTSLGAINVFPSIGVASFGSLDATSSITVTDFTINYNDIVNADLGVLGTSITQGYTASSMNNHYLQKAFRGTNKTFINYGQASNTFAYNIASIPRLMRNNPSAVMLEAGVNDAALSVSAFRASLQAIYDSIVTGYGKTLIILKDFSNPTYDTIYYNFCAQYGLTLIDPASVMVAGDYSDGTHPNDKGFDIYANFCKAALPSLFGSQVVNDRYSLKGLNDILLSSPSNGQALTYNSTTSKWVNSTLGTGYVNLQPGAITQQTGNLGITGYAEVNTGLAIGGANVVGTHLRMLGNTVNNVSVRGENTNSAGTYPYYLISQMGVTGYSVADWPSATVFTAQANGGMVLSAYAGSIKFQTGTSYVTRGNVGTNGLYMGGNTAATARLHLAASTTAASSGQIKFVEGSNLTTPEDGNLNYVSNNLNFTEGSTVYTLAKTLTATATLNFGNTPAGVAADLTVTVTGAAVGDAVYIGADNASVSADNISFWGWVSATNTVTVRFNNNNLVSAVDPASGTFRVVVTKY